ncbi:biotin synthase BioB [Glutamicibacter protophormiae]|uniref:biotin synthase BioB n=1 Tax=Glutamicibacter protophormiae TaxID=37930 RepID=UPI002A8346ED|nr:biotin synthase BioB [Glutamicibacter protophormiae]WPR63101.1 biotin synthase BioB [Glutamicibacter protophormiae]WPR66598.1 biotin synthase BioB [Glutamicibacter protophormiae]
MTLDTAAAETAQPALLDADELAARIASGHRITEAEALAVLATPDFATLPLVGAAGTLRRQHFGNTVKVNYLVNLKSGLCPEDCTYCSQRLGSKAEILKYTWLKPDEAVAQAGYGIAGGASRVCMVASGKGPTDRDVDRVATMVEQLKGEHPQVEVCACLGILKDGQAARLKDAGADAYNHNLNTSESLYPEICTSHSYQDRVDTVQQAQSAGLSSCSGLIVGLGETPEQLVEAVFALRELGSDSIPVNFLMPFDGTPMEGTWLLTPLACLRILALVRLACPDKELRIAGGREMHLRSLQSTALEVANSIFLGDYLTSEGQGAAKDLDMIADAGFVVLGQEASSPAEVARRLREAAHAASAHEAQATAGGCASGCGTGCGSAASGCGPSAAREPVLRRRGAGTQQGPNA